MDLSPFEKINPCGYADLRMTDLAALQQPVCANETAEQLVEIVARNLGYNSLIPAPGLPRGAEIQSELQHT